MRPVFWAALLGAAGLLAMTVFLLYVYGVAKVLDESFFTTLRDVCASMIGR